MMELNNEKDKEPAEKNNINVYIKILVFIFVGWIPFLGYQAGFWLGRLSSGKEIFREPGDTEETEKDDIYMRISTFLVFAWFPIMCFFAGYWAGQISAGVEDI